MPEHVPLQKRTWCVWIHQSLVVGDGFVCRVILHSVFWGLWVIVALLAVSLPVLLLLFAIAQVMVHAVMLCVHGCRLADADPGLLAWFMFMIMDLEPGDAQDGAPQFVNRDKQVGRVRNRVSCWMLSKAAIASARAALEPYGLTVVKKKARVEWDTDNEGNMVYENAESWHFSLCNVVDAA